MTDLLTPAEIDELRDLELAEAYLRDKHAAEASFYESSAGEEA